MWSSRNAYETAFLTKLRQWVSHTPNNAYGKPRLWNIERCGGRQCCRIWLTPHTCQYHWSASVSHSVMVLGAHCRQFDKLLLHSKKSNSSRRIHCLICARGRAVDMIGMLGSIIYQILNWIYGLHHALHTNARSYQLTSNVPSLMISLALATLSAALIAFSIPYDML